MQVGARRVQGRDQPEHQPRDDRHGHRERQHPPIERHDGSGLADTGETSGVHGEQRADARHAQRHAKYAAGQREQDAFGQQLADDAAAPRADRRTNGNFTLTSRRAGEQQVGDVCACNQQHQRNRAQQDPECGADVGDEFFLQQPRAKRAVVVDGGRILLLVLGCREFQPGVGLIERHAGLESSCGLKVVALVGRLRVYLERDVQLGLRTELAEVESGSDDADDDVRFATELDGLAQNLLVGIEATHPQRVTHQRDMRLVRPIFGRGERPSHHDGHTEELEVLCRHLFGSQLFRQPGASEIDDVGSVGGDVLDDVGLAAPVSELGRRRAGEAALGRGRLEDDHAIRVGIGDGLEQHRVDDGEDGGVGADPQCQGADGGQGEAGALEKRADGVPGVGQQVCEGHS